MCEVFDLDSVVAWIGFIVDVLSLIEGGRSLDRVPVFSGEGILGSLLETLLAFRQALVPVE